MSFIESNLAPREIVTYQARTHPLAYIYPIAFILLTCWPAKFSSLATTRLVLTPRQVIGKRGLIYRKHIAQAYAQIDYVKVQQGLLGKIFDYGTLTIISKNGLTIKFPGIALVLDVQQQIDEAIEMAVLGRKITPPMM